MLAASFIAGRVVGQGRRRDLQLCRHDPEQWPMRRFTLRQHTAGVIQVGRVPIVGREGRTNLVAAITRLHVATAAANRTPEIRYRISYSIGEATYEPGTEESFVELVERADAMMYGAAPPRAMRRIRETPAANSRSTLWPPESWPPMSSARTWAESHMT
jgi:hypothetical protein